MAGDVKLITNYIYLYHTDKFIVIPEYPESITDTMTSEFSQTNSLSRSAPVFSYKNSGPRTVTVSFDLHRDMMNDLNTSTVSNLKYNVVDFKSEDYVDRLIAELQSISLPRYKAYVSGSKSVIPPMVAIRFGNDIFIKGVVASSIQVTYKKPILANGKYACVTVGFQISETDPYDADIVASEGSFRGITQTFKNGIFNSTTASTNYLNSSLTASATQSLTNTVLYNGVKTQMRRAPEVSGETEALIEAEKLKNN